MKKIFALLALIGAVTATAHASSPPDLLRQLKAAGIQATAVEPGPVAGLYTVVIPKGILYVDAAGEHVFNGTVFDLKTHKNLTEAAVIAHTPSIDFAALPLQDAIVTVKGNGKRRIVVFSDPDCPYCKRLENETMPALSDVTIYTFLVPFHPDAPRKAREIWCAPDRAKAWTQWMHEGKLPGVATACDTPLERNIAMAERFELSGTPMLVFTDGSRLTGSAAATVVEEKLRAAKQATE
ncbi:DsbC family protein [Burkholderia sp. Ac-20365]|uniref:thioredoxin fold domain-containing protein n=1 Tax=Burkholderia sp. Ac-20365 TaxID=2703897 RepID=UPI00197C70DE|nr:DsbC family protein [Burkholderia sp. Ac-20365]